MQRQALERLYTKTAVLQDMKNAADAIRAAYKHLNEIVQPSLQGQVKYERFKFSFSITL
jgi:hypothetical protein